MNSFALFAFSFIISFGSIVQAQTSGGPDTFGYHWANNQDPIGSSPTYIWKDIKDTANLVNGLGDDNSSALISPGFYYNYYGQWYNTLWIGSNGWISFQNAGNVTAPFPMIPTPSAPDNIIAGLLSDLTFTDANNIPVPGAAAYFWSNNTDSIIVQYDSVPFWDSSATGYSGRNTFQIILTSLPYYSITFQYKELINSTPAYDLVNTGLRIGIEDSTGNDGLQVSDTFPSDSSAIKFFYPGHFSTNDLNNLGLTVDQNNPNPANESTIINFSVQKTGNINISTHDMLGNEIDSFVLGKNSAGYRSFSIDTRHYLPGIYLYTVSAEAFSVTKKMVVLR